MSPTLQSRLPQFATAAVLAVLYVSACFLYEGFFSLRGLINLLTDNAALVRYAIEHQLI